MMSKFLNSLYDRRAIDFVSSDGWFILSQLAAEEKPFTLEFEVECIIRWGDSYRIMRPGDARSTLGIEGFMRTPLPADHRWRSFSAGQFPRQGSDVIILTLAGATSDFWYNRHLELRRFRGKWLKVDRWLDTLRIESSAHRQMSRAREASR